MPKIFASRPRATLRRGPTGAVLSAVLQVYRRPGESVASFQCRLQRDFGAAIVSDPALQEDGPIRKGEDAPVSRVEWQVAPSGFVLSARMVPLDGSAPFTVFREPAEGLGDYMGRLREVHGASYPPMEFIMLHDAEQLSGVRQ